MDELCTYRDERETDKSLNIFNTVCKIYKIVLVFSSFIEVSYCWLLRIRKQWSYVGWCNGGLPCASDPVSAVLFPADVVTRVLPILGSRPWLS